MLLAHRHSGETVDRAPAVPGKLRPGRSRLHELQPMLGHRIEQRNLADVERETHLAR
jgi:hypothetical protein